MNPTATMCGAAILSSLLLASCANRPPPEPPPGSVPAVIEVEQRKGPTFTDSTTTPAQAAQTGSHSATKAECEAIAERVVDLKLKEEGIADPAAQTQARSDLHKAMDDTLLSKCVGQPLHEGAMDCARGAATIDELQSRCLN